jgi:membrane-associated phospholipid phosphatase
MIRSAWGWLIARLQAQWRLKAALTCVLGASFGALYFLLQRHPNGLPHQLPLSAIDRAVPFEPGWAWVYQSLYAPINLVPWLSRERAELRRYTAGFTLTCAIGFATFLVCPTVGPRPDVAGATGLYALLVQVDMPGNAFPSLHAALLAYTIAFALRLRLPTALITALSAWVLLILYATLATKQHYAVDLVAGVALALACDWFVWRFASRGVRTASARIDASNGAMSQDGFM